MICIFPKDEIPIGYIEILEANDININDVKYILHEDYGDYRIFDVLDCFTDYRGIPITNNEWIYAIYKCR